MSFSFEIRELKRIWEDLEKQLLEFNEIVPFEKNPHDVYSPRLVNQHDACYRTANRSNDKINCKKTKAQASRYRDS